MKAADIWTKEYSRVHKFAKWMRLSYAEKSEDRIRVAILDTGVKVEHDSLQAAWLRRQINYRNFCADGLDSQFPVDTNGHGTHVTSLLLSTATHVDVYMARISEDGKQYRSKEVTEVRNFRSESTQSIRRVILQLDERTHADSEIKRQLSGRLRGTSI